MHSFFLIVFHPIKISTDRCSQIISLNVLIFMKHRKKRENWDALVGIWDFNWNFWCCKNGFVVWKMLCNLRVAFFYWNCWEDIWKNAWQCKLKLIKWWKAAYLLLWMQIMDSYQYFKFGSSIFREMMRNYWMSFRSQNFSYESCKKGSWSSFCFPLKYLDRCLMNFI